MNNVLHAIRTENQASTIYLQQLEALVEANKNYLAKVMMIDLFLCFCILEFMIGKRT
jgi:hypothetical protein